MAVGGIGIATAHPESTCAPPEPKVLNEASYDQDDALFGALPPAVGYEIQDSFTLPTYESVTGTPIEETCYDGYGFAGTLTWSPTDQGPTGMGFSVCESTSGGFKTIFREVKEGVYDPLAEINGLAAIGRNRLEATVAGSGTHSGTAWHGGSQNQAGAADGRAFEVTPGTYHFHVSTEGGPPPGEWQLAVRGIAYSEEYAAESSTGNESSAGNGSTVR